MEKNKHLKYNATPAGKKKISKKINKTIRINKRIWTSGWIKNKYTKAKFFSSHTINKQWKIKREKHSIQIMASIYYVPN